MRRWNEDDLLIAFGLYCQLPFGKMHRSNPQIINLAKVLNRTPSAIAMKLVNFASFDPVLKARGISGLKNVGVGGKKIWEAFEANPEEIAYQIKIAKSDTKHEEDQSTTDDKTLSSKYNTDKPSEEIRLTRSRLVQSFFRNAVLSSYEFKCAICLLQIPELLIASHIIPWVIDEKHRADPKNGISLCAFHDKAFDIGLITIDPKWKIIVSSKINVDTSCLLQRIGLLDISGMSLTLPHRFAPSSDALKYHRQNIFIN